MRFLRKEDFDFVSPFGCVGFDDQVFGRVTIRRFFGSLDAGLRLLFGLLDTTFHISSGFFGRVRFRYDGPGCMGKEIDINKVPFLNLGISKGVARINLSKVNLLIGLKTSTLHTVPLYYCSSMTWAMVGH